MEEKGSKQDWSDGEVEQRSEVKQSSFYLQLTKHEVCWGHETSKWFLVEANGRRSIHWHWPVFGFGPPKEIGLVCVKQLSVELGLTVG